MAKPGVLLHQLAMVKPRVLLLHQWAMVKPEVLLLHQLVMEKLGFLLLHQLAMVIGETGIPASVASDSYMTPRLACSSC